MDQTTTKLSSHCEDCGVEIGGFFGNKVYRHAGTNKCSPCGQKQDESVQMSVQQTGMTPNQYQRRFKRAWNE